MKIKKLRIKLIVFATFNFLLYTYTAQAQVCFSPAVNFSVGSFPKSIISADFNGDTHADLAITKYGSNAVGILLGNGAGNFVPADSFSVGNGACSIISADFNGDGKADLATANKFSNNVSVLLGNGTGAFGASTNFAVGANPTSLISADFNGDGHADLAIANGSGSLSVLLGNGIGGFGSATNWGVGLIPPCSVFSTDFNADGKADLAVTNANSFNVSVLLGNGTGGFSAATNFQVGFDPRSIISADFNMDGKADLATTGGTGGGSSYVSVLLGNGAGSFANADSFALSSFFHPYSVLSADFNGDSKADLAVTTSTSNISILLGNGAGSFGTAINFALGDDPQSFINADFNGDNKSDLAIATGGTNKVSVFLNSPLSVTANASASIACAGTFITLTGGGATSYTWTGGVNNGIAFAAPSSTTTYTVTGTSGICSNTATKTITINPKPSATFTLQNESFSGYCDGSIVAHLSGGTGTIQAQWFVGQTVFTTNSISGLCPGADTLRLTDSQGCSNIYIETILTGTIPPTPSICLVTVDSTHTHNLLVWEKTNLNMAAIDSFIVYREFGANNYHRIGAVSKNSMSVFDDTGVNPASTGYRYKLKSKNAQGIESLFSNYHNTIYLTNNDANFSWTQYQIENNTTPVSTYNIYRDDNSTGNFQNIGFTSGNQFGYTDLNFNSHPNASYYVEAVMAGGICSPSRSSYAGSRSNVKHVGINGVQQLNSSSALNIYPNPAGNLLSITGITGKTTLRLYDVIDKLILEKEVENNTTINTSQLAEGIYTLLTVSPIGKTINKVVISR